MSKNSFFSGMRSAFVLFPEKRPPIESTKVDFDQQFNDCVTRVLKIMIQVRLSQLTLNPDTEKQLCQKISKTIEK